jgi:hypothetical protein
MQLRAPMPALLPTDTWPEYAVKVVSTSTIQHLGYEERVRREIAVLTALTHPNIARLVSAFRWRDGAYLVLEYASQGDLHSLLSKLGSLGEESARFLMAEALAALLHIHDKVWLLFGIAVACALLPFAALGCSAGVRLRRLEAGELRSSSRCRGRKPSQADRHGRVPPILTCSKDTCSREPSHPSEHARWGLALTRRSRCCRC